MAGSVLIIFSEITWLTSSAESEFVQLGADPDILAVFPENAEVAPGDFAPGFGRALPRPALWFALSNSFCVSSGSGTLGSSTNVARSKL